MYNRHRPALYQALLFALNPPIGSMTYHERARTSQPAVVYLLGASKFHFYVLRQVRMEGSSVGRLSSSSWPPVENLPAEAKALLATVQVKKQAVKRHHHKHNLKHRYEFLETLGKGTYGKVKKARERSGRLVSLFLCVHFNIFI